MHHAQTQIALRQKVLTPSKALPQRSRPVCASGGVAKLGNGQKCRKQKVLILPGFLSGSGPYYSMAKDLERHGYSTDVLEIGRSEWYPTLVGFSFEWYVKRLAERIDDLYEAHGKLILVAHSAGGWIARICLGSASYLDVECNRASKVKTLITMGTPHLSLEDYPFGRFKEKVYSSVKSGNQSKTWDSSLRFANELYGDASTLSPVRLITIIGSGFRGKGLSIGERVSYWVSLGRIPQEAAIANFAYTSYKVNCGEAEVDGDGVCPAQSSLLPGAKHVVLPHVYHGPNNYGLIWYGSSDGIDQWKPHLTDS